MAPASIADRQRELNAWTRRFLRGVRPLAVDGVAGRATNSRIMSVKWYLGYGKRGSEWNSAFVRKLRHPHDARYSPPWQLALGARRRSGQRAAWARSHRPRAGTAPWDGRQVAAWMVPHLEFARGYRGPGGPWQGVVLSGVRDPAYSESLCRAMCGAPQCPGRCAGRASNHAQWVSPHGAIDVTDPRRFAELMEISPHQPRIFNALGAADPNHFSATGR